MKARTVKNKLLITGFYITLTIGILGTMGSVIGAIGALVTPGVDRLYNFFGCVILGPICSWIPYGIIAWLTWLLKDEPDETTPEDVKIEVLRKITRI